MFHLLLDTSSDYGVSYSASGSMSPIMAIIWLAVVVLFLAGMWKAVSKAGQPGWSMLVPIYNYMVLSKVAGKSGAFGLLMLIPFVNFIAYIVIMAGISKNFGKGTGTTVGLIFLAPIFFCILGFGDARFQGQLG